MTTWTVERWLSPEAAAAMEYSAYWNDEETERAKPFHVLDDDFDKLERYLEEVGLVADLRACLGSLDTPLGGRGIDLAAGTLWAVPLLLHAGPVERLYCLEYSEHRLLTIGPRTLEHYKVAPDKVVLVYGSFYELRLEAGCLDFAFLSQAFHHADRPAALLAELRRVLKPGGLVFIIGEHILRPRDYVLYAARSCASVLLPRAAQRRLLGHEVDVRVSIRPTASDVMPTDAVVGDHAYSRSEYQELFSDAGFTMRRVRRPRSHYQSFLLERLP
jgi:ubiquinone/menaquinone biosynthesis C-methylase UbiE